MIPTPDRTLIDAQSAFVGRNLVRVARIGTHFYPLICPLGAPNVPKMGISWSKCSNPCPNSPRSPRCSGGGGVDDKGIELLKRAWEARTGVES